MHAYRDVIGFERLARSSLNIALPEHDYVPPLDGSLRRASRLDIGRPTYDKSFSKYENIFHQIRSILVFGACAFLH